MARAWRRMMMAVVMKANFDMVKSKVKARLHGPMAKSTSVSLKMTK